DGVEVELGVSTPPKKDFAFAVISPAVPMKSPLLDELEKSGVLILSELELGFQRARCLSIAIAGTNGKGTTAELLERMLDHNHRKVVLAGHQARPVCSVADQTQDLDF